MSALNQRRAVDITALSDLLAISSALMATFYIMIPEPATTVAFSPKDGQK